jgi:hypothetical protein
MGGGFWKRSVAGNPFIRMKRVCRSAGLGGGEDAVDGGKEFERVAEDGGAFYTVPYPRDAAMRIEGGMASRCRRFVGRFI